MVGIRTMGTKTRSPKTNISTRPTTKFRSRNIRRSKNGFPAVRLWTMKR
jgi:hypothetical protein